MRTTPKVLLAAVTVALACAGTGAAASPPGTTQHSTQLPGADYPWVQPPAWVGTGTAGAPLPATASLPGVQPPASIPLAQLPQRPVIAGSDYPWVQLPAWVGTGVSGPLPTASYPWVQPPAWIPIQ